MKYIFYIRFMEFVHYWMAVIIFGMVAYPLIAQPTQETPVNFKIAFIGDQGLGEEPTAVLNLIKNEGTHVIVHSGDFDYANNPQAWDDQINSVFSPDFPYFASIGNHDGKFYGSGGYQEFLAARMNLLGITWDGDLGVKSSFTYQGIFFSLTDPTENNGHDIYVRDKLEEDNSIWSVNSWHKNMKLMQVGGKSNATGWGIYEESRRGGAIVATGHEHSYGRTHLLSSCENQTVASTSDTLILTRDLIETPNADEGKTFVFHSGLGGYSIRPQKVFGEWWAGVYTRDQNANHGALFGVFNYNGNSNLAKFYFKDIDGAVPDSFYVISAVQDGILLTVNNEGAGSIDLNPPGGVYDEGTVVTLTANPASGWTFTGWSGDLSGSANPETITMDASKNVTATFAPPQYDLTVTSVGSGTVDLNPPGGVYDEGTIVTLMANPDTDWTFSGWSGDMAGTDNPANITMDSDKNVTMTFIINEPPVAVDDAYSVEEDNVLSVVTPGLLGNDSDPDGDALTASELSSPSNGTLSLSGDGSFTYTPNANFNGTDTFTYTVSDGKGGSATGTVTVTVTPVNDAPVAAADNYTTDESTTLNVAAPGVLGNDSDVDGDGLMATEESGPANGTLTLNVDGSFTYTPVSDFTGTDTFSYSLSDGNGGTTTGNVTITVNPATVTYAESQSGGSSDMTTVTTMGSLTAVSGHLYLAAIASKPYVEVIEVSGLGLGWTRVQAQCGGRHQTGVEVWKGQGIPIGSGSVTATFARAPRNAVIVVSRYSGVDLVNPIGSLVAGNTNGAEGSCSGGSDSDNYSFNLTTSVNGSVVFGAVAMRNRTHTPGAGYTKRMELMQGTSGGSAASLSVVEQAVTSSTVVLVDGTFNSRVDWAVVGLEIKPPATIAKQFTISENDKIMEDISKPDNFLLYQNYPNPFNLQTNIEYTLPEPFRVRIVIFNLKGQLTRKLVDEYQPEGFKRTHWDGKNEQGRVVNSGIYFLQLRIANQIIATKLIFQK